jgi:CRISPR-associated endonuclease Csn1
MSMGLRFAFDIGTNSIGYAVWRTGPGPFGQDTPLELCGAGVRIFKDGRNPKDGQSLATMRRVPRQARRRRDRFLLRRADLLETLLALDLLPADAEARARIFALDPYALRARALDERLEPHEIGRVLFHLNQRRGFKSNRKADRKDADKGKIAQAAQRLRQTLEAEGCRTFGELLWRRHQGAPHERAPTRIRMEGSGAQALYAFYPTREMLRHEFDLLWASQAAWHKDLLTEHSREAVAKVLFRQRPLRPPKVGKCTLVDGEERLPKALPSVEAREIYERLAHLRLSTDGVGERPLRPTERDVLASKLLAGGNLTFLQLRKALRLGGDVVINLEETGEKGLEGARTAKLLAKDNHYGRAWLHRPLADKDAFVAKLIEAEDDEALTARLMAEHGLSEAAAGECATIPLADGYSRLGATANAAILDALIHDTDADGFVVTFAEAVRRCGWHHSDERDGEVLDRLPYYARLLQRHVLPGTMDPKDRKDEAKFWGRVTNPTVHIGLNQLRLVINALIAHYGRPDQIAIELARELKLSREQKEREQKRNRENRAANDRRVRLLAEQRQPDTPDNRIRLRLFEELAAAGKGVACCPYTGKAITIHQLFSPEVEIDHILPVSETLDDSLANRVLCYREANRIKRKRTPWAAFHALPGWDWPAVEARGAALDRSRRWRFRPDALEEFKKRGDFLDRQLNETRYLSRLAKAYVQKVCVRKGGGYGDVFVTPGQLVGLLRGKWGLNSVISSDANRKNRTDHRHHAIDAIVIGALTRGLVQRIATEAAKAEQAERERIFDRIPTPIEHEAFRAMIRRTVETITVSFKPEHGKGGALHEDTAYGILPDGDSARELGNLVFRKPLPGLTASEAARIRDPAVREWVMAAIAPLLDAKGRAKDAKALQTALASLAAQPGPGGARVRRVRVVKPDDSAVALHDRRNGKPYKAVAPGENHHVDIVQMRDGSWRGFAASLLEVNKPGWRPVWEREKLGGKLVMRLHKGDMVEIDRGAERGVKVVHQIWVKEALLCLAPHNEGGALQVRHKDEDDSFRWDFAAFSKLKGRNCLAVAIDPVGRKKVSRSNVG